jgi:hypothetical protein
LASIIVDRTHTMRGSGRGATSTAISPLGLDLDLIEYRVLMRMHGGAQRRMAALRTDGRSQRWDGRAREESGYKAAGAKAAIATTTG